MHAPRALADSALGESGLEIRIRDGYEDLQRAFIQRQIRLDPDVTHEPASALQKARGIGQGGTQEETDIHVGRVGRDIAERDAIDACGGAPIVQELQNIWPTRAKRFEPPQGQRSKFQVWRGEPLRHVRMASTAAVEWEQSNL